MTIKEILEDVANNELSVEDAYKMLEGDLEYATIDYGRKNRTGVGEIIYGKSKTSFQIKGIIKDMLNNGQRHILVTKMSKDKYDDLKVDFPDFIYDEVSELYYYQGEEIEMNKGIIAVVCAGTSDLPIANEAAITARFLGNEVIQINDVGVSGLHRLLLRMDAISKAQVIIVVAGMEGALASVIGGLTDKPIIAVPTSVGYGASFGGVSALLSMLNSCASGMAVVNIDNGFGAGYMAHTINCIGGKR